MEPRATQLGPELPQNCPQPERAEPPWGSAKTPTEGPHPMLHRCCFWETQWPCFVPSHYVSGQKHTWRWKRHRRDSPVCPAQGTAREQSDRTRLIHKELSDKEACHLTELPTANQSTNLAVSWAPKHPTTQPSRQLVTQTPSLYGGPSAWGPPPYLSPMSPP